MFAVLNQNQKNQIFIILAAVASLGGWGGGRPAPGVTILG